VMRWPTPSRPRRARGVDGMELRRRVERPDHTIPHIKVA
jgi:hypothetical protein